MTTPLSSNQGRNTSSQCMLDKICRIYEGSAGVRGEPQCTEYVIPLRFNGSICGCLTICDLAQQMGREGLHLCISHAGGRLLRVCNICWNLEQIILSRVCSRPNLPSIMHYAVRSFLTSQIQTTTAKRLSGSCDACDPIRIRTLFNFFVNEWHWNDLCG